MLDLLEFVIVCRWQTLTRSVDTLSALLLRTVTDGGSQTNQRRLVLLALRLNNRVVDTLQVTALKLE